MVKYVPETLQDALNYRARENVIPYCGGTDLMIEDNEDLTYLFLHKIPELRQITRDDTYLHIGAACTFTEVEESPLTPDILKEAISLIAAPAIRNLGSIGGNIGNGSPKADSALIFYVTDAKLILESLRGTRILPIKDFYLGRKKLDLKPDELIVEVMMPYHGLENYYYKKIGGRNALAISRIAFAGLFSMDGDRIKNLAVAIGAVSDTIIRREDIDAMMIGKTLDEAKENRDAFLSAYNDAIVPIRGRVSSEYRKSVCMNLLKDFLAENGI